MFTDGENAYAIDSASAWNEWLRKRKDSRLGAYVMYSNLRYEKIKNFHNAKWTEDVDKGYSLKAQISKNYEQLGSDNNDIRLDFWTNLYLGVESPLDACVVHADVFTWTMASAGIFTGV